MARHLVTLMLLGLLAADAPADDALRGLVLGGACLNCHGDDPRAGAAIPGLAGRSAADIGAAMRAFRAGAREATVMQRLARGYSDAEIDVIADWLAGRR